MRKQMEGDNQRRRALARQARSQGQRPSETGASLGATKQLTSLDQRRRNGPAPAGRHKPTSTSGGPAPPPVGTPESSRPIPDDGRTDTTTISYQDLVTDVGRRSGVDFPTAKVGVTATVLTLARALGATERGRLLAAVPTRLHDITPVDGVEDHSDLPGFLAEVGRLSGRTPEQARYQAAATLTALADRDGGLVESLHVPEGLQDLLAPPEPGGGVIGATAATPPLDEVQLREVLTGLPYWSGDRHGLSRTVALPAENLGRVLDRLDQLRRQTGRGPSIGQPDRTTAVLTVATSRPRRAPEVTGPDVDLAHAVDDAIDEVGAGMAG
ncbi:DUF2267 domain-containing protein [Salinispora tropica]|uniref:DUF2267 domain-containing protein n=1 Tax=Salinispora tropica (strain ATCC BAA-916 / DSM 44818 / JCM 13857 / NBRC 105044 / CNB-440) TaxID=369723 RepID=A4X6S6_SALTO|nr:DUF2267 domain-containing protein [Salinispora tropica]ABP54576.1 hypothetical protein Strop_2125 [Salinispora tropica CNB-440]